MALTLWLDWPLFYVFDSGFKHSGLILAQTSSFEHVILNFTIPGYTRMATNSEIEIDPELWDWLGSALGIAQLSPNVSLLPLINTYKP